MSAILQLRCTSCLRDYSADDAIGLCEYCGGVVDTVYDLTAAAETLTTEAIADREGGMWRWRELLPVRNPANIVSMSEGGTPLYAFKATSFGFDEVYVKDETRNPTASFKDRGASSTISKLKERGVSRIVVASEGNASCSFALYSRLAGVECRAWVPSFAHEAKKKMIRQFGAALTEVKGTLLDAGREASEAASEERLYNCSTFLTPYRHDGKGTMALEIVEQLDWSTPDVIVYPTGGGVGLVGMWKKLREAAEMGLVDEGDLPRMIAVQSESCAPVVKAFHNGREDVEEWRNPKTIASGLLVPKPAGGQLILRALKESSGAAVAVSDENIRSAMHELAREGVLLEPSSAAAFAGLPVICEQGIVDPRERVVVIATGSGMKTLEDF